MGRSDRERGVRRGQTIVAERERAESEAERALVRKRKKRRKRRATITLALLVAIAYLVGYTWLREWSNDHIVAEVVEEHYQIRAEIVDEEGIGQLSARVEDYIAQLEQDLTDYNLSVIKFTLPTGKSRELYVDLSGYEYYFKVSLNRDTAVTAEDISRMVKYLSEREIHPEYVDVRVSGKAYYKLPS